MGSGVVQTTPEITTLTASVNAGGTAVTLSAAHAVSLANDYWIQFETSDDWYPITAHTAATTAVTISPAYVGAANLTAGKCTIRRIYYSLDATADRVIDMYEAIQDRQLVFVDPRELDRQLPDPTATGTPNVYTLLGFDSASSWRANFYPIPDSKLNIHYRYYKKTTDMANDTDKPQLPEKWHSAIIFVALSLYGHAYVDDDRLRSAESRSRQLVGEMVRQISPLPDKHRVIQPWDHRGSRGTSGAQFPPDFPAYWR
jgi:hypothetical protein